MTPRSRGAMRPKGCWKSCAPENRGRREDRVRAAPAVSCAMCTKKTHTSIQVQRRQSGLPCAMVLRLIRALLGDRLSCHRRLRSVASRELDASIGAPGPHDFAVRVTRVRQSRIRVHRIPPHVRDDREPPLLSGETARIEITDLPEGLSGIFFARAGQDLADLPVGHGWYVARMSDAISGVLCRSRISHALMRATKIIPSTNSNAAAAARNSACPRGCGGRAACRPCRSRSAA